MKHFAITVSGKVQGVFFRVSTKDKADELGLKGIVRNEPSGDVYIEAEGNEEALNQFKAWCHYGPPLADVHKVTLQEAPLKNYDFFIIQQ